MKKSIAALLSAAILTLGLAACGGNTATTTTGKAAETTTTAKATTQAPEATTTVKESETSSKATESAGLKTGLGIVVSLKKSADPGKNDAGADVNGKLNNYAYAAAVTVDKDGKIANCQIDAVISDIEFNAANEILTAADTSFKSKNELGANYGMIKASKIGKEWNEQAQAFADYCVGKSIDEIKGMAVKDGYTADADLATKVSVHVSDFINVVEKAVKSAADLGAKAGDKLGLGIVANASGTKAANAEKNTKATLQAYNYYVAATFAADGKITSAVIDATQGKSEIEGGKLLADLTAEIKTKNEIGDGYGMKKASKIGKEWNEQAAAFAAYVVGKSTADVKGIAVDDGGRATDSDLNTKVSVHISEFQEGLAKAEAMAK